MDNRLFNLTERLERVRMDIINRPPEDPLSRSLREFYSECTPEDLESLAAEMESDEV